jgi:hypothetical protein
MITNHNANVFSLYQYCPAQEFMAEIEPQTDAPSTTRTPTSALPITTGTPTVPDCTVIMEKAQDGLLLIVMPAIVALILIIIVIVVILLCIFFMRAHNQKK